MKQTSYRPLLRIASAASAAAILATTLGASGTARADEVSPKGKGIVGGALLGAEVVTMVESFADVRPAWAYAVGGIVGAAGGGVGGYFIEQSSTDGRVPVYMLAGGLALVIPAVVLTLNATRYRSDEAAVEETSPTMGPPAEPGNPAVSPQAPPAGAPAPAPATTPAPSPAPSGGGALLRMTVDPVAKTTVGVGVPLPVVKQMWSVAEQKQYGLGQGTELRMPVLHVTF